MKKILFFLTASAVIFSGCAKQDAIDARVKSIFGSVFINGVKLESPGGLIKYGDKISTGEKSFCEIVINEKNIFKLGADTVFVFKVSSTENTFLLEKGWIAGLSRKKFTKGIGYIIKSPTVVASIRGTSFCTKVESPDKTYFCVCNGSIDLQGDGGGSEKVTAAHHAARRFIRNKEGKIEVDSNPGLLYHNDEGLEALSAAIGEKIDWSKPDLH